MTGPSRTSPRRSDFFAANLHAWRTGRVRETSPLAPPVRLSWFNPDELCALPDELLIEQVTSYGRSLPDCWHPEAVARQMPFLRHALTYFLCGSAELPERYGSCTRPGEAYFLAGLGRSFWGSLLANIDPLALTAWHPAVERGMRQCGLLPRSAAVGSVPALRAALAHYRDLVASDPSMTAWHWNDFFANVGRAADSRVPTPQDRVTTRALRTIRNAVPLRKRLAGNHREHLDADAAALLDDALLPSLPALDRERLLGEFAVQIAMRYRAHSCEIPALLNEVRRQRSERTPRRRFAGFSDESFRFLDDLQRDKSLTSLGEHRPRYRHFVRDPLRELAAELVRLYVHPVLRDGHGWSIEDDLRPGKVMTRICKNDFDRANAAPPSLSLAFGPRTAARRGEGAFFVRLDADGLRYGFASGRRERAAGQRLRRAVQQHADTLFEALRQTDAHRWVSWSHEASRDTALPLADAADLRAWSAGRELLAGRFLPANSPLLRQDELVGELMLTFDRLLPLFAASCLDDAASWLDRHRDKGMPASPFDRDDFTRATCLSESWLANARHMLDKRSQLLLLGVPGVGKTTAARNLAKLIAGGRTEAIRFVSCHPHSTYAELVGGPRGDGALTAFARKAAGLPTRPHVLILDDVGRTNLPGVFGEWLALLESRAESVVLPHAGEEFRLPTNLAIIATGEAPTVNAAVRRRFEVVAMLPDAAVLARWFELHPPADADPTFGPQLLRMFETLNDRLARDCGPDAQIGPGYLMVENFDAALLRDIWRHRIAPLCGERKYTFDALTLTCEAVVP